MMKLLLLIAMLLMPLGMVPAAAAPAHHYMAGGAMGHCPDQAPSHGKKAGFAECTMACAAALPAMDTPDAQGPLIAADPPRLAGTDMLTGLHPETATPPPRRKS